MKGLLPPIANDPLERHRESHRAYEPEDARYLSNHHDFARRQSEVRIPGRFEAGAQSAKISPRRARVHRKEFNAGLGLEADQISLGGCHAIRARPELM